MTVDKSRRRTKRTGADTFGPDSKTPASRMLKLEVTSTGRPKRAAAPTQLKERSVKKSYEMKKIVIISLNQVFGKQSCVIGNRAVK